MSATASATEKEQLQAAMLLRAGQLVAMPTETVYGLAADASLEQAVGAIYALKQRPADHPLIVHVLGLEQIDFWADRAASDIAQQFAHVLAGAFWPGPLSMVLPRRKEAPAFACAGQPTIALRAPSHPVAAGLLREFHRLGGKGIAAPSANLFGRISPTRAAHVRAEFGDKLPLVLEGGDAEVGIESTIVDLSGTRVRILRPGHIRAADIGQVLDVEISETGEQSGDPGDVTAPKVSGSLAAHYAPRTPMRLLDEQALLDRALELLQRGKKIACLVSPEMAMFLQRAFGRQVPADALQLEIACEEAQEFAHSLYAQLRTMDQSGVDELLVQALPEGPQWVAVADRLKRAATGSGQ